MYQPIVICLASLSLVYVFSQYRALQRHIKEAKSTGFSYVVCPIYFTSIPWIILQESFLPLLSRLPKTWTDSWLPLSLFYRIWHCGYEPFRKQGEDTFMVASPGGNLLWTCDPSISMQVLNRSKDFPKKVDMLAMLNMYGPTVTASEGEENRLYRKIATPSFNETTHSLVWSEAEVQAKKITAHWHDTDGYVANIVGDSNRFALHILTKVFYGRELGWNQKEQIPPSHVLPFSKAISDVFHYNDVLFLTPRTILNNSPFRKHREAKLAFVEFRKYLEEIRDATASRLHQVKPPEDEASLLENFVMAGTPGLQKDVSLTIPPAAVMGNLFIFILAGHETSANLMANAITLLACFPAFQSAMQISIDAVFSDDTLRDRSYPEAFTKLLDTHVGALMKETLRLYAVLPFIPKTVSSGTQSVMVNGEQRLIPEGTVIMVNTSALHRSPKNWPPPRGHHFVGEGSPFPLSSFYPERWMSNSTDVAFDPVPGAYMPFGEGFRACMGSRFARVEFCAAIANIFREYNVELANENTESALAEAAESLSTGIVFEMGIKPGRPVPLRFVRRSS
ncbi:cytochrome P450 [Lophiostoma macrostomum CBS 122681]|uniref:Cytochrome P450 n=1 Tax=Lophiostoma macrostomum CBS 122681 TaxID=1314788 RepID=A0A6A6TPE0_9PLEO|nr:cytochrome P450 [Lophiostoma macrostomum CBS 122681]